MFFRPFYTIAVTALGLAALTSAAQAQVNAPAPYSYPPGGYRGVPLPGSEDIMTVDPEDEDQVNLPGQPGQMPAVQPYQRPGPYNSRIEQEPLPATAQPGAGSYRAERNPNLDQPQGNYAVRPGDAQDNLRPPVDMQQRGPSVIESSRPPATGAPATVASLPAEDQPEEDVKELPPQFKRQLVDFITKEPAGTIIIDTPSTYLYLVLGNGKAMRYGIGVGRDGFTWAGTERITRMAEWPDWHPPAEMIERQPYLPRFMAGGPANPLGARALYLGKTIYRVHGTNQPSTIGKFVSSGCIRMVNDDVEDLYSRVKVGTRVVVLPSSSATSAANTRQ